MELIRLSVEDEKDILEVARLESEIFTDAWSKDALIESLNQPNAMIIAAKEGEMVIGYLIFYFVMSDGDIIRLAVDEKFRRQGVAGEIIEYIKGIAKKKGITKLLLDVRERNKAARRFYKKMGFSENGKRPYFYKNPDDTGVLMTRKI